ncbi:Integrase zinc binding domain [Popillia japonica]|uniref:RNA-directed DNA polymerase n=1 Tax=Popillia japonica TaxID=7064 RepID=A0AAW1JHT8_POPJA
MYIADLLSRSFMENKRLIKYNFDIEYLPGSRMYIADLLSRSFMENKSNIKDENIVAVHCLNLDLPISERNLDLLKTETARDPVLLKVKQFCCERWPKHINCIDNNEQLIAFSKIKDNLRIHNGLVFFGDKIIVPEKLRQLMLQKLHNTSHLGIEKCKARARKIFYWPSLTKDVTEFISKCIVCLKFSRKPPKEPLLQHTRPNIPFYKIAADILTFGAVDYLTVVDYYSNWIELVKISSKSTTEVISKLKVIFATHGIPTIFVSDNVPFNSLEFKTFAKDWDFDLITFSPKYPQSNGLNGLAERAVGICKNILRKCNETGSDIQKALLEYRCTPLTGVNFSPSELLNNRLLRTTLPATQNVLTKPPEIDIRKLENKRMKAKHHYDKQAHARPTFKEGDSIILKKEKHWVPAQVMEKTDSPRSYIVKDHLGNIYRRNSSFLKPSPNPFILENNAQAEYEDITNQSNNAHNSFATNDANNYDTPTTEIITESQPSIKTRSGRVIVKPVRYRQ